MGQCLGTSALKETPAKIEKSASSEDPAVTETVDEALAPNLESTVEKPVETVEEPVVVKEEQTKQETSLEEEPNTKAESEPAPDTAPAILAEVQASTNEEPAPTERGASTAPINPETLTPAPSMARNVVVSEQDVKLGMKSMEEEEAARVIQDAWRSSPARVLPQDSVSQVGTMSMVEAPLKQQQEPNIVRRALVLGAAAAVGYAAQRLVSQQQMNSNSSLPDDDEEDDEPEISQRDTCLVPELADQLDVPTVCMRMDVEENMDGTENVSNPRLVVREKLSKRMGV